MTDESTFKTVLGMCQMMLRQKSDDKFLSFPSGYPAGGRGDTEHCRHSRKSTRIALIVELEERFTVYAPLHQTLGQNDDHIPWLPQKLGSLDLALLGPISAFS